MNKTKKILRSLVVVGVVGAVATAGAFSAFSGQTDNPNNQITAGTVDVQDNDATGALYSIAAAKPNDPKESCIEVKYTGSLPADIKMYRVPGALGSLGSVREPQGRVRHAGKPELPVLHRLQLGSARCTTPTSPASPPPTPAASRPPRAWTATGTRTRSSCTA